MKQTTFTTLSKSFLLLSSLSILSVSLAAFFSPQSIMDLVQVKLQNNDALSSIRGVYGGVGLTIFLLLVYLFRYDLLLGLKFLTVLWGLYALSRLVTIFSEGPLGDIGTVWLIMETSFFLLGITLAAKGKKFEN
jgi:hypothetical protein